MPEEAQQLPQWLPQAAEQELMGRARLVFRLDAAGCMPSIETTENGGSTDEAQNFSDPFAGSVPSDAAPGDGDGRPGDGDPLEGRQAYSRREFYYFAMLSSIATAKILMGIKIAN